MHFRRKFCCPDFYTFLPKFLTFSLSFLTTTRMFPDRFPDVSWPFDDQLLTISSTIYWPLLGNFRPFPGHFRPSPGRFLTISWTSETILLPHSTGLAVHFHHPLSSILANFHAQERISRRQSFPDHSRFISGRFMAVSDHFLAHFFLAFSWPFPGLLWPFHGHFVYRCRRFHICFSSVHFRPFLGYLGPFLPFHGHFRPFFTVSW